MTLMIAPSRLFKALWIVESGVKNVEINGLGDVSILICLITRFLNPPGVYSSGSLILKSEAKRPATSICFVLMPAESMLDHLYNRGGISSDPGYCLELGLCFF